MTANHAPNIITIECKEIHGTYNTCPDPLSTLYDKNNIQKPGMFPHDKMIDCHCHKRTQRRENNSIEDHLTLYTCLQFQIH